MIEWRDEGLVLAVRSHGESDAIADVFTPSHGRHAGIVRGGAGRRLGPALQPGTQLALVWTARLEDHLGAFAVEPVRSRSGLMGDPLALSGMAAVCALLTFALPDRQAHQALYDRTQVLLDLMATDADWPLAYLRWEVLLLDETGFGLDLGTCAVTGGQDDLAFVSPRTGRAVSRTGAGKWADRLLPLPRCLAAGAGPTGAADLLSGLNVTGHFLRRSLAASLGVRPLPPARQRLIDRMRRQFGRTSVADAR
jgi:DNA repair protein RecO (recombination protein O)